MYSRILSTPKNYSLTLARVILAAAMLPHGLQKLLGLWGGRGVTGTMALFVKIHSMPPWLTFLVIMIESFGSLFILFGLLSRVNALGTMAVMIGALVTTFRANGYFLMNWGAEKRGEGIEYHLLAIALAVVLVVNGSGALSLDRLLARGKRETETQQEELALAATAD